jgi:hypothetical protein
MQGFNAHRQAPYGVSGCRKGCQQAALQHERQSPCRSASFTAMNCASKHGDARLGLHPAVHIVRTAAVHLHELCYQALSGHNKLLMQGSKCAIGVSPAAHGHVVCWWHSLVVQEHKKIYLGTVERIVQWMAK